MQIAQLLISPAMIRVNQPDRHDRSPLKYAVGRGHTNSIVQLSAMKLSRADAPDNARVMPRTSALMNQSSEICEAFVTARGEILWALMSVLGKWLIAPFHRLQEAHADVESLLIETDDVRQLDTTSKNEWAGLVAETSRLDLMLVGCKECTIGICAFYGNQST